MLATKLQFIRKLFVFTILFAGFSANGHCQKKNTNDEQLNAERKYASNFTGLKLGIGHPYYAIQRKDYTYLSDAFNYSFASYLEIGHKYKSGLSFSLSPALVFSKFVKQSFEYDMYVDQILIQYIHGEKSHTHLSVFVPLFIEMDLGKHFRVAGGGFMYKLLTSNEYESSTGKTYYRYVNGQYVPNGFPNSNGSWGALNKYDVPRYVYGGWQLRVSYVVKSLRDKKEWALSLEYFNSLERNYRFDSYERWINLVYSKRIFHLR